MGPDTDTLPTSTPPHKPHKQLSAPWAKQLVQTKPPASLLPPDPPTGSLSLLAGQTLGEFPQTPPWPSSSQCSLAAPSALTRAKRSVRSGGRGHSGGSWNFSKGRCCDTRLLYTRAPASVSSLQDGPPGAPWCPSSAYTTLSLSPVPTVPSLGRPSPRPGTGRPSISPHSPRHREVPSQHSETYCPRQAPPTLSHALVPSCPGPPPPPRRDPPSF